MAKIRMFLTRSGRELRKKAFFQYYQAYEAHRNTLAAMLAGSIRKDVFYSRVRGFADCRASGLFADNVPETVYDNLVAVVRQNLSPLFRYFEFRRRALALPDLHVYDTYVPIVNPLGFRLPYEEAVEICLSALHRWARGIRPFCGRASWGVGRPLREPWQAQRGLRLGLLRLAPLDPVKL